MLWNLHDGDGDDETAKSEQKGGPEAGDYDKSDDLGLDRAGDDKPSVEQDL